MIFFFACCCPMILCCYGFSRYNGEFSTAGTAIYDPHEYDDNFKPYVYVPPPPPTQTRPQIISMAPIPTVGLRTGVGQPPVVAFQPPVVVGLQPAAPVPNQFIKGGYVQMANQPRRAFLMEDLPSVQMSRDD